MSVTVSEIRVGFHGDLSGVGELAWGQLGIWRRTQDTGRTMNVVAITALPPGTLIDEVAAILRFLVGRHPALRTRLRYDKEPGGSGRPQQVVVDAGQVPLQILDIDDGDDAAVVAEELRARYEATWFDYETEFPVRMGVIRRKSGALAYLVAGYSHVMTDGVGIQTAIRDLTHLDRATGEATAPAQVLDPLELARIQSGPAGRRQNSKSLRYWAAQLERLPTRWQAAEPADRPEPRYWELVAYSPAMELGLRAIADRTKAPSNYVLIAAYAVAVARVMGRDPTVVQLVVSNRFRPGFAETVGQVSQPGICVVDVADAGFDEVVVRAWTAATNASLHAYYDPQECDQLLDETEARWGRPLDISWHLNDRRGLSAPGDDSQAPLTPVQLQAAIRDALPHTKLYWDRKSPVFDGTLFIQVDSSPEPTIPGRPALEEGLPAVYLEVWTDTRHFAPAQIEAFIREMEAIVVQSALEAAVVTGASWSPTAV